MTAASSAVFLSYASEDADAAQRICDALRTAGIEVWFDRHQLRGGDVWDTEIRRQIKACALFIPVISRNTHARDEGYFRLEWKLAVDRSHLMVDSKAFLLPVVIDETPDNEPQVPDRFRAVQWTRLAGGVTTSAFVGRVSRLVVSESDVGFSAALARGSAEVSPPGGISPSRSVAARGASQRLLRGLVLLALGLFVVTAVGLWSIYRGRTPVASSGSDKAAAMAADRTIAVLSFVNMSSDAEQEYFSQGLAEELIDVLTRVPGLRVSARTSSFAFKGKAVAVDEIGRALGVRHLLEGSVRKAGDRLRVTAQLVRAGDGFHEWSQTYDRDVHDVFAVQDEIARSVAEQLRLAIVEGGKPASALNVSPETYSIYLQARFHTYRDTAADLDAAVEMYERAIAAAPDYAAPWAWFAYCQTRRIANGDTTEATYRAAKDAAARAIALDPNVVEGYVAGAISALQYSLDWSTSKRLLDEALSRDPNNPLALQFRAHLTQAIGSNSEAEIYLRRAVALDPLNLLHRRYLARIVLNAGRANESAAILKQAIDEDPSYPALHYELARALIVSGKPAEAVSAIEAEPSGPWRALGLPFTYHVAHREALAQPAMARIVANSAGSEFQVAENYAMLGQPDRAFEWLEIARKRHDAGLMYVRRDPMLASVVADPRFRKFLERIGLPIAAPGE